MVPLQPPSTVPAVGSSRMAKSPAEQGSVVPDQPAEAALDSLYFLMVVEDEGDVLVRFRTAVEQAGRQRELHGDAALHVGGAAAVQEALPRRPGGPVRGNGAQRTLGARQRDGVKMAGEDDPFGPAEAGAGDQCIAVAGQLQLRYGAEGMLHGIGEPAFRPRDAENVDDVRGQQGDVAAQVKAGGYSGGWVFSHRSTVYCRPFRPAEMPAGCHGFRGARGPSIDLGA